MRLDKLVAEKFGMSRRSAQEALRRGQIDLRGKCVQELGLDVPPDAAVTHHPHRPRRETLARRLTVLYEDPHILIVDKPAGVITQPTQDRETDTLLERVGRHLMKNRGTVRPFVGVVHRLDRDTSGVLLLVRTPEALRPFQAMFRTHDIERLYLGVAEHSVEQDRGTIDLPLIADRGDWRKGPASRKPYDPEIDDGPAPEKGEPALTHYEVVERFGKVATLVRCRLETGRTHQIRIHFAAIGKPIVGDAVYRPRKWRPFPVPIRRQALHALSLGFIHPITGESVRVEAPVPADLNALISELRDRSTVR